MTKPLQNDQHVPDFSAVTVEQEGPLPVTGFKGTPEEIERQWYEQVYRGRGDRMPQLTWRAVLMGSALGGVLSAHQPLHRAQGGLGLRRRHHRVHPLVRHLVGPAPDRRRAHAHDHPREQLHAVHGELGGLLHRRHAHLRLRRLHASSTGPPMSLPDMLAWVFFLAVLGVTMAIPMKRQMINVEQLRFPSGIAAAETLAGAARGGRRRGARGAGARLGRGHRALLGKFWAEGLVLVSGSARTPFMIGLLADLHSTGAWLGRSVDGTHGAAFLGAHVHRRRRHHRPARVAASMLLGSVVPGSMFVPVLQRGGVIEGAGYAAARAVDALARRSLHGQLEPALVCAAVAHGAARLRAISGRCCRVRPAARQIRSPPSSARLVVYRRPVRSASWGLAWLGHRTFGMPYWQTAVAVLLSFALALVACRVTGETDTTPVGAMGKITQLVFGVVHPGNVNVNLMSANVTAAAASSQSPTCSPT